MPRIGAGQIGGTASPDLAGIIETIPRTAALLSSPAPSAGTMTLTYFTADQDATITTLTSVSRATAGIGATLARMGLFTAAPSGDLTCVARTASDTTLWQTANTVYTRPIADTGPAGAAATSLTVTRGQRYAFATLHVGSTTAPALAGIFYSVLGLATQTPRLVGYATGQTDIPATVTTATLAGNAVSANAIYGRLA